MKRHFWVYLVFAAFVAGIFDGDVFLKQPLAYDGEAVSVEYKSKSESDSHSDSAPQSSRNILLLSDDPFRARFSNVTACTSFTFNPRLSQGPPNTSCFLI